VSGEPADPSKIDLVGQVIDQKYKVLALLGRGGMGAVYLAHHLQLNKDMALKTFATANLNEEIRQRFKREAQALGKLKHKNIVQVFDFGIAEGGLPYYTMEHLDGESVAERIARKGMLDLTEALYVFSELCKGLLLCHKNGVVHRDIKPANIFLELRSSTSDAIVAVKLVDFGIAALSARPSADQQLTAAGTVFGSPLYMSPEQSLGEKVDARSDIYSSGCALFEMLTGKPPFRAATAFATMLMHQEVLPPTLAEAGGPEREQSYPDWLEQLVAALLAKDPSARPQSLAQVLDRLGHLNGPERQHNSQSGSPRESARTAGRSNMSTAWLFVALVGIGLLALASIGAFFVSQHQSQRPKFPLSEEHADVPAAALTAYRLPAKRAGFIRFRFPREEIGKIGQGDKERYTSACGDVEIADGPVVYFRAGQAICDRPELLMGFGATDLRNLYFDGGGSAWSDKTVASIEHLTSIKKVVFSANKFTPAAVASLNKLPELIELGLSDSTLTGEDLLKLKCLPQLQSLVVSGMKNVSPVITRLVQKNSLFDFTAQDCNLGDADMHVIGRLKSLLTLNLEGNSVTAKRLSALYNLPNLKELNLNDNPIEPSALAVMLKLKTPMIIYMPSSFWNAQTIAPMEKRFGANHLNSKGYAREPD